jgi:hypothetical protein
MAGLDPASTSYFLLSREAWMPGTRPGMTRETHGAPSINEITGSRRRAPAR